MVLCVVMYTCECVCLQRGWKRASNWLELVLPAVVVSDVGDRPDPGSFDRTARILYCRASSSASFFLHFGDKGFCCSGFKIAV